MRPGTFLLGVRHGSGNVAVHCSAVFDIIETIYAIWLTSKYHANK